MTEATADLQGLVDESKRTGDGYWRVELRMYHVTDDGDSGGGIVRRVTAADWPKGISEQGAIRGSLGLLGVNEELPSHGVELNWMTLWISTMPPAAGRTPPQNPIALVWTEL